MTGTEFGNKYTSAQLKEISRDIAGSIVIRDYINGNSRDTHRETTDPEKEIIKNIAYGSMMAYGYRGGDLDGILAMAEFTLMQFIRNCNTYNTIYIPLRNVTETW